jgi:hypothetical protein
VLRRFHFDWRTAAADAHPQPRPPRPRTGGRFGKSLGRVSAYGVVMARRLAALIALAALFLPAAAVADGDPASDVLYLKNVFLPYPAPSSGAAHSLEQAVANAYAKRFRVKIAVVASASDLGSVPVLFGKPAQYAKFLGAELQSFYVGPLLVVMPAGIGVYDGGRSTAAEDHVLSGITVHGSRPDELTQIGASAVRKLLAAGALRSKDITRPFAIALPSSGKRGGDAKLRFSASDDSMRARLVVHLTTSSGQKYATLRAPLRILHPQRLDSLVWRAPRGAPGRLRFCVVAIDAAGNRSVQVCAQLRLS